jgi:hypothetical protein
LDEDNAKLMLDRFSDNPILGEDFILWKKDARSLITFIYLADKLDFLDKSSFDLTRPHDGKVNEGKEGKEGNTREIQYLVLVNENFRLTQESAAWSNPTFSLIWKHINEDIIRYRKQIAKKNGIKEEDASDKFSRKKAIIYSFQNKDVTFIPGNDFDKTIYKIFADQWQFT